MNKVVIINDMIDKSNLDGKIELELISKKELFAIPTINIFVKANSKLKIEYKSTIDTKMNINIEVADNVAFNLDEFKKGVYYKTKYQYTLGKNSNVIVNKFYYLEHAKELVEIDLNKEKARLEYNFITIANGDEKYEIIAHHNANNTTSLINSKGLTINEGAIMLTLSGLLMDNVSNCNLKQEGRTINLNCSNSEIKRNLYGNHNNAKCVCNTLVNAFKENEIKEVMKKGLKREEAVNYLIKDFISDGKTNKKIEKIIDNIRK